MAKKNVNSIRLDEEFLTFLEKAQANRVVIEVDVKTIGNPRMSKIIARYFKLHHDNYLELLKMGEDLNV